MYQDERGTIKDLIVGKDYSVTHITFTKGAVRGNHLHKETFQVDTVLSGKLFNGEKELVAGDIVEIQAGTPHAYRALEDSEIISTCFGKRIGDDYSKDTFKLETPLL